MGLVKYLPDWFPGAGFKRNAVIWKKKIEEFVDKPYQFVLDERVYHSSPVSHAANSCLASDSARAPQSRHSSPRCWMKRMATNRNLMLNSISI